MARSLNKVILIGNLTRDPELRYTPSGTAVCTFSLATNRQWKTESGENRDEAEYHRIVAWDKLGEICSQMLKKGKRTYIEGRLQSRKWTGQDGVEKTTVEIVASDMLLLDSRSDSANLDEIDQAIDAPTPEPKGDVSSKPAKKQVKKEEVATDLPADDGEDIPF